MKMAFLRVPMANNLVYLLLGWVIVLVSCSDPVTDAPQDESAPSLINGSWVMMMDLGQTSMPIRWDVQDNVATIVNGQERIEVSNITLNGDSISIIMPRYNSAFHGIFADTETIVGSWHNYAKDDYHIPFLAKYESPELWVSSTDSSEELKYEVTFSPRTEDEYPAIGLLSIGNGISTGSFLTETGDYRYLQGDTAEGRLTLSCFDGAHMFLFTAEINEDELVGGQFYSGKHWQEPWYGIRNPNAELTHPDSLTFMVDGHTTLNFTAKDARGHDNEINQGFLSGYVTIVQIFGTWCPNCYDENVFYKELYQEYHDDGLRIIPVAFEKGDTYEEHREAVVSQFQELAMPYPVLIAGKSSKKLASEMFPQVNEIISFPTSFFLDRSGTVRKIHTGFYGPGTGRYYKEYTANTHEFIQELLSEDLIATH